MRKLQKRPDSSLISFTKNWKKLVSLLVTTSCDIDVNWNCERFHDFFLIGVELPKKPVSRFGAENQQKSAQDSKDKEEDIQLERRFSNTKRET